MKPVVAGAGHTTSVTGPPNTPMNLTVACGARRLSAERWTPATLSLHAEQPTLCPMDSRERVTIEPGKRSGKPCIRGLRITVYDILDYLAGGMTEDEILADFPDLERDDMRAVLTFAADRERRLIGPTA